MTDKPNPNTTAATKAYRAEVENLHANIERHRAELEMLGEGLSLLPSFMPAAVHALMVDKFNRALDELDTVVKELNIEAGEGVAW